MPEEYYWKLAFTFAIPMIICMITTIIIIGIDADNVVLIFGAIFGALAGTVIGALLASIVHYKHKYKVLHQIEKGGFVLWVTTLDMLKAKQAKQVMKRFGAYDIHSW